MSLKQNNLAEATTEQGFPTETSIPLQREVTLDDGTVVTVEGVTPAKLASDLGITYKTPGEPYVNGEVTLDGVVQTYNESVVKTLVSIAVTTPPTKLEYNAGEVFDPTGMVVTATYTTSDSKTIQKAVTGYTYAPTVPLTLSNAYMSIQYTENEVTASTSLRIYMNKTGYLPYEEYGTIVLNTTMGDAIAAAISQNSSLGNLSVFTDNCGAHEIAIRLGTAYENGEAIGNFGFSIDTESSDFCISHENKSTEKMTVVAEAVDSYFNDLGHNIKLSDLATALSHETICECSASGTVYTADNKTFSVRVFGYTSEFIEFTASDYIMDII